MEPSVSTEGEQKERKKIQFAVPTSAPSNLDPRQVEMIRRRRPTPATLFRVADQASPDDDPSSHQWVVGENGILKPKRINQNVYQPPSLKAVQKMAEAHMQHLGVYTALEDPCEDEEEEQDWQDWQDWQGEDGEVQMSQRQKTRSATRPEILKIHYNLNLIGRSRQIKLRLNPVDRKLQSLLLDVLVYSSKDMPQVHPSVFPCLFWFVWTNYNTAL
uniref:Protein phosphatase 1 regulatory subunit 1B n=1 Tax=Periophthalmus magnuspinnatus TaxID=409849 RepID=A0A3B3ZDG3_9GOBI